MKLTIVEKNLLSWTAMHIDFVMCKKKSHSAEKNPSEKHQRGVLCFRGSGRRCFCFGRGSGVSSMFWTSVVQVDVEQMNKKWTDRVELTKKN